MFKELDTWYTKGWKLYQGLNPLWLASPSDVLIVVSYAPKQSFRNFVEMLFGWVSQRLAGHCFSDDKTLGPTQMKNVVDGVRDGFPA